MDWAGIAAAIEMQRQVVRATPLRMKSANRKAVKALQIRLGAIGFDAGTPDGLFGRKTFNAVRRYQKAAKVPPVDGIVGIKTWDAMWRPDGDISDLYS
jgi:peptidoglycan hydrolase-like protein with peptidoglycan-binding domain